MSTIIKSCSPGTKCDYILNEQGVLCFFKVQEVNEFMSDEDSRSLNDTGAYILYESDVSVIGESYSGESGTADAGGVRDRILDHKKSKPKLTNCMALLNATEDGHRKFEAGAFKFFEHLFRMTLKYADKTKVINVSRTGEKVSPDVFRKIICPTLIEIKYRTDGMLANILAPSNDSPSKPLGGKAFTLNNEDDMQVYLKNSVILKHSHFKFPHKKIRESNDCYTLLCNLINAGLCIPYVFKGEVVMKFITDVDLNVPHIINGSQKKDFFVSERLLVNLMGSSKGFEDSFK